jgi:UDP-2-acetamido-3-amino-2,3-dideoxy-glucuronate N-acetyltransferase
MPEPKQSSSAPYFVHESSYVDDGAVVGDGTKIWHFCHVLPGAIIGKKCSIGQNVNIGGKVRIGDNVKIQNNVSVYDNVTLEDDVFCGPSMVFTNVINPRSHISRKSEYKDTIVRKGATIGANATILCGTTIGRYAFIGAGAVVTRNVHDHALIYGNPARQHGWMCQCGVKLKPVASAAANTFQCPTCEGTYELIVESHQLRSIREPRR